jgi:hypothetical protein
VELVARLVRLDKGKFSIDISPEISQLGLIPQRKILLYKWERPVEMGLSQIFKVQNLRWIEILGSTNFKERRMNINFDIKFTLAWKSNYIQRGKIKKIPIYNPLF